MWIRVVELVVAGIVFVAGLYAMLWHRLVRKALFDSDAAARFGAEPSTCFIETGKTYPALVFQDLELRWKKGKKKTAGKEVVIQSPSGFLGGCCLTAITGPSGSGKTSLMRLLSGFTETHMTIECGKWVCRPRIAHCPQVSGIRTRKIRPSRRLSILTDTRL
mmetsp:Transcript_3801/g.10438  ORF Transcript_3801/g.10438 Transcript_3801/m.10438 type:complete len:162 (+) Transcript_3801:469-954(+)